MTDVLVNISCPLVVPVGVNVYHCVTRCGQDIDSILHLTPSAIGQ